MNENLEFKMKNAKLLIIIAVLVLAGLSLIGFYNSLIGKTQELRSVENVTQLMDELAGTENRISVERRRYNDLVRDYNTTIGRLFN